MSIEDRLNGSNPWMNDNMCSLLTTKELDEFQRWFFEDCICSDIHINYDPSIKLYDPLLGSGCYEDGQFFSSTEGSECTEEVVALGGSYTGERIAHGFNVKNGNTADFSFKRITKGSPQFLSAIPGKYYEMVISNNFITRVQEGNKAPYELHEPLLINYWCEQTRGS